jgi:uncharacterized membrane-anchored protein YitT (DUF2179 family)
MSKLGDKLDWGMVFNIKNMVLSGIGTLLCAFALNQFMVPNHFLDGGVTGISILLHEIFQVPLWVLIPILNIPFVYLGYLKIGKTFTAQTIIMILFLVIFLTLIPVKKMTTDPLLIAVFGGFLIGAGMGLCIRGGGVVDGLEIIAVYTTKKIGLTSTEVILYVNSLLFLAAALEFDIETAMYSIITYYTAIKSIEYVVDGIEEYIALNVISQKSDEVKCLIVNKFEKGITDHKGERGYLPGSFDIKQDCDIIVTIVTRLELLSIEQAISDLDPKAFMYVHSIKEAKGGVLKQKAKH